VAGLTINYENDDHAEVAEWVLSRVVGYHVELAHETDLTWEQTLGRLDAYKDGAATVTEYETKEDGEYLPTGRVVEVPWHAIREVTVF